MYHVCFQVFGLMVLGVGLWLSFDDSLLDLLSFVELEDTGDVLSNGILAMIILGGFIVAVGFVGCIGSLFINRVVLGFVRIFYHVPFLQIVVVHLFFMFLNL